MKKKLEPMLAAQHAKASVTAFPRFIWLPSLAMLVVAVCETSHFLWARDFNTVAIFHYSVLQGLSKACFVLAGLLTAWPAMRRAAAGHVDRISQASRRTHLSWTAIFFFGFFSWLGFIRFCQYWMYILPVDSANEVNAAYTFLHTGLLEYSAFGSKVLAIHFFPLMAVFSPVLWIWNSPLALIFVQHFFVCSAPLALYALVFLLTDSALAGFSGMLLALSSPFFFELFNSNLHNASLCALFPWAMFCFYHRRWVACGALIALMICCTEQVPLIFFGLGFYLVYALRERKPLNWLYGCGLSVAAVILWLFEMRVIRHYDLQAGVYLGGSHYWQTFAQMVPAGVSENRILGEVVSHPIRSLSMSLSIYKLYPVARLLFSMGFLCLLAPFQLLPFWTTALPHILAASSAPDSFFNHMPISYPDFGLHHSSYVFGPLLWATAYGIRRSYAWLSSRGAQSWLLVWALFFSGFGFRQASGSLPTAAWQAKWYESMPKIMARVPPKARLWVDEYASTPLSNRRWLQIIQWGPGEPFGGYQKLFKPDYVLLDVNFVVKAKPPYRDQMLTFLAKNDYLRLDEQYPIVLLKASDTAADPDLVPEWIHLPEADAKLAKEYGGYLLSPMNDAVENHIREAVTLKPDSAELHSHNAELLIRAGRFKEATEQYQETLRLDPGNYKAHANLGICLAQLGKMDAAVPHLREAIRLKPDYYFAHVNLGLYLAQLGKVEEAEQYLLEAIRLKPDSADPHVYYGNLFATEGRFKDAIEQYQEALRLDPNRADAKMNLGRAQEFMRAHP